MEKIIRKSTADLAVEKLIEFIKTDKCVVGEKLPPEHKMCSDLGISRSTLREAYSKLEILGYTEAKNGRGIFVKRKDADLLETATRWFMSHDAQMSDYLEVRFAFDPMAAKIAAKKRTDADIAELKQIQIKFKEYVTSKNNRKAAEYDALFHQKIVDISGNELLMALEKLVNRYFMEVRQVSFEIPEHGENALIPHNCIIDAIETKDVERAIEESKKHIQSAINDLCRNKEDDE